MSSEDDLADFLEDFPVNPKENIKIAAIASLEQFQAQIASLSTLPIMDTNTSPPVPPSIPGSSGYPNTRKRGKREGSHLSQTPSPKRPKTKKRGRKPKVAQPVLDTLQSSDSETSRFTGDTIYEEELHQSANFYCSNPSAQLTPVRESGFSSQGDLLMRPSTYISPIPTQLRDTSHVIDKGTFYSISQEIIDYTSGQSKCKPHDFNNTLHTWFHDEWDHLVDPPDGVTAGLYMICLPNNITNTEKRRKFANATINLKMAKATSSALTDSEAIQAGEKLEEDESVLTFQGSDSRDMIKQLQDSVTGLNGLFSDFGNTSNQLISLIKSSHNYYEGRVGTVINTVDNKLDHIQKLMTDLTNLSQKAEGKLMTGAGSIPSTPSKPPDIDTLSSSSSCHSTRAPTVHPTPFVPATKRIRQGKKL